MRLFIPSLLLLFSFTVLVAQEEKVYTFHSDINVDSSGVITVREHIRIYARGDLFKRGITRSLPLTRRDREGNRIRMEYGVTEVRQDGNPVGFFTENEGGDMTIYVGERDILLQPGFYSYEIVYETAGQVGFFDEYDELSWNVNGESDRTIDSVSAVVHLPEKAEILSYRCYAGAYGSTESNCVAENRADGSLFIGTVDLPPREMLTLSVGFTKGAVRQPPSVQPRKLTFFDKNGLAVVSIITVILLFFYYIHTWRRFGIDPPKPVVIPQFTPPDGLSPASVGMLYKGWYLDDLVTTSIVNLSVKGYIFIEEVIRKKGLFGIRQDRCYSLTMKKKDDATLPPEERVVMQYLFSSGDNFYLDGKYNRSIENMMQAYRKSLNHQYGAVLREGRNLKFHIIPWLVMIAYLFILIYFANENLIGFRVNKMALYITLPLMVVAYPVYAWLIVRPGERKLHYRSSIEGLKMYLDFAEEKQLQFFNPPSVTPAVFEQLLPYAIALDMEKVWGEKFEKTFLSASMQPDSYRPAWYGGTYINPAAFGHALNSTLSNTVNHAAIPPKSSSSGGGNWSSGSFGGGFSGMGGGGGRVGGW
ncbi:MAG: DUF2207 domain-containing protein [Proteiniphilum sp.]|uniref:DUF2207 domain-containing protein n=1 Tax=Proteiniphilum sp. TaxID=1926877 RepID=UPI002ABBED56|nr:DUF2207 domain-containing protein [Proteiniphilum sp.]MDY9918602.1 DUF2207 domain-containing protein [Proteiniphilum sp.]